MRQVFARLLHQAVLVLAVIGVGLTAPTAATADVPGFGDGSGFTLTANGASAIAGLPSIDAGTLQITSTQPGGQAASAFFNTKQDVGGFVAQFDYHLLPPMGNPADGAAFVLQNSGLNALGAAGGGMAYMNVPDSAALILNVYNGHPIGTEFVTGGVLDYAYQPTGNINLRDTNPIRATLTYDGSELVMGLADLATGETFSRSIDADIPAAVGGGSAWVGFTGATGGLFSNQQISNFTYVGFDKLTWDGTADGNFSDLNWLDRFGNPTASVPDETIMTTINNRIVTVDTGPAPARAATLSVDAGADPTGVVIPAAESLSVATSVNFGPGTTLTMGPGAALTAGTGGSISAVGIDGDSTINVGIGSLSVGSLADATTAGTLIKGGNGTLSLGASGGAVDLDNSAVRVSGGTLSLSGADPLAGSTAPVQLDGGTLQLLGSLDPTPDPGLPAIAGLQLHLDASAIVSANGATVGQWDDLSGNNNHATLSMGAPIYRQSANGDGIAAVEFGPGAGMVTPLTVAGDDYSVFVVFDSDQDSGAARRAIHGSNNWLIGPYNGMLRYHMGGWAYVGAEFMPVDEFVVTEASNSAAAWAFYENGQQRAGGAGSRGAAGQLTFGADNRPWTWGESLLGDIAEVLVYDSALSEADRGDINFHFQQKYGLGPRGPLDMTGADFVVTQDSTLEVVTDEYGDFGALTLQNGILTTKGTGDEIAFTGTQVAAGATAVGIAPETETFFGVIDGSAATAPFTFTVGGNREMVVEAGTMTGMGMATIDARGGTLNMIGAGAWAGATKAQLSGGTMSISAVPIPVSHPMSTAAYYSFEDPADPGHDDSGNGHDGTLVDTALHTPVGVMGGGLGLIGANDRMEIRPGGVNLGPEWTVSAWFEGLAPVGAWRTLFRGAAADHHIIVEHNTTMLGAYSNTGGGFLSSGYDTSLLTPDPHQITAVGSEGGTDFYIDGEYVGSSGGQAIGNVFSIGNYQGGGQRFADLIDEVYIHDRALNAGEVADLFAESQAPKAVLPALAMTDKDFTVTDDSALFAGTDTTAAFGDLTLKGGTLTISGAPGGVSFTSTTVNVDPASGLEAGVNAMAPTQFSPGGTPVVMRSGVLQTTGNPITLNGIKLHSSATAVGFNFQAETDYGQIDGNLAHAMVSKTGPGAMILNPGDATRLNNATLDAQGGRLVLGGNAAWGNATEARLSGGTLEIHAGAITDPTGLNAGLVGAWLFDEGAGTTAADSTGNGDGVVQGASWVDDPERGSVLAFNAVGQVAVPGGPFATVDDAITVAFWQNGAATQPRNDTIFQAKIGGARAVGSHLPWSNSNVYWDAGGAASCCADRSNFVIPPEDFKDRWNHWAFTKDTNTGEMKVFINGVERDSQGGRTIPLAGIDRMFIGSEENVNFYDGMIDEFLVYDRAVTPAEVSQLFIEGIDFPELPAIAMAGKNFTVTADSTLKAASSTTAAFGGLTHEGGMLTITGAPDSVTFTSLTVNATGEAEASLNALSPTSYGVDPVDLQAGILATMGQSVAFEGVSINAVAAGGTVGFNPQTDTDYGGIDGNLLTVNVAKTGPGTMTLIDGDASEMGNATWVARGGNLKLVGTAAWGGSTKATLAGGTLTVTDVEAAPVDPAALGGLQLHLDAGAIVGLNDGDVMGFWSDQSGNLHDTIETIGDPTYQASALGGEPAVRFNGNDGFRLGNLSGAFPSAATLFVVTTLSDPHYNLFTTRNNDTWWRYHGNGLSYPGLFRSNRIENYTAMPDAGSFIFAVESTAGGWEMFQDGASQGAVGGQYNAGDEYRIGMHDNNNGDKNLNGDISEILVYDKGLSGPEMTAVGFYLQEKYGLDTLYHGEIGALEMTEYDLTVTADSTLNASTSSTAAFGALTLQDGVATVVGAPGGVSFTSTTMPETAGTSGITAQTDVTGGPLTINAGVLRTRGPVSFDSTTIPAAATRVGLDGDRDLQLGVISGGGAGHEVTISKVGADTTVLTEANTGLQDATWAARGGTLTMLTTDPLGGATKLELAGGTFQIENPLTNIAAGPGDAIAHFEFDDPADLGYDSVNTFRSRTNIGNPAHTADGLVGGALVLDGGSQINVGSDGFPNTPFTISAWLRLDDPSAGLWRTAVGNWQTGALWAHLGKDNTETFGDHGGGHTFASDPGGNLQRGKWYHVVSVRGAGGENQIWLDGVKGSTSAGVPEAPTGEIYIGSKDPWLGNGWVGLIDELQIYNRALTPEEIIPMAGEREPLDVGTVTVDVTANSTLSIGAPSASFGDLTLQNGVMTTTGALDGIGFTSTTMPATAGTAGINAQTPTAGGPLTINAGVLNTRGPVSFDSTLIPEAATAIGLDTDTAVDLGVITGGGAGPNVTISKVGTGELRLAAANQNLAGATWQAEGGRLTMTGEAPWGGSKSAVLAGGTLNITGLAGAGVIDPGTLRGLEAHFDAGVGLTTDPGGIVLSWEDQSGNTNDAVRASGHPFVVDNQVNGLPVVQLRGNDDWLDLADPFYARSVYAVFRSPNPTWSTYGSPFGSVDYNTGRTFIFEAGQTYFHSNPFPPGVRKNGIALGGNFNLAPIDEYMVLGVDTAFADNLRDYRIGSQEGWAGELDIAEILVFDRVLSGFDENRLGFYLQEKYGIAGDYTGPVEALTMADYDLTVIADSTLQAGTDFSATLGTLTVKQGILATSGAPEGIFFASTSIEPATGVTVVGFAPDMILNPGPIDAHGAELTIVKNGVGDLVLDHTNAGIENVTFDVRGGRLIGIPSSNPFDVAPLVINGGEVVLGARQGDASPVRYDNAVTVTAAGGTLTAGKGGQASAANAPMTIIAGSDVAVDGTLALQSTNDYVLSVEGEVSGSGGIAVDNGTVDLQGALDVGSASLSGGSLSLAGGTVGQFDLSGGLLAASADVNVTTANVVAGEIVAGSPVLVHQAVNIGDITYRIADATIGLGGADLTAGADLTVDGGTLTVLGPPPFSTDGLQLWLDAGTISGLADGGVVNQWDDVSGNGNHATTRAGSPTYQSAALGGKPAVHFDLNSRMETDATFTSPYTILYAGQMTGGTSRRLVSSATGNWLLGYWGNRRDVMYANGWVRLDPAVAPGVDPHIYAATRDATQTRLYGDGTDITADPNPSLQIGRLQLNSYGGNQNESSDGDVAELLIYNRALSAAELNNIGGYLEAKYDLDTAYEPPAGGGGASQPTTNLLVTDTTTVTTSDLSVTLGDLTITNPAPATPTELTLDAAAYSFANVAADDGATINGDLTITDTLSLGGALNVNGQVLLADNSTYRNRLDGAAHGNLANLGNSELTLAGTLDLVPVAVGPAQIGQTVTRTIAEALSEGVIQGNFDAVPAAGTPGDRKPGHLGMGVFNMGVTYVETIPPTLPDPSYMAVDVDVYTAEGGDSNADGNIDGQDIQTLIINFNLQGDPPDRNWLKGDTAGGNNGRGDGWVDGQDITDLITHFTGDPGPADPGGMKVEYNFVTGEFIVSAKEVMSWNLITQGGFRPDVADYVRNESDMPTAPFGTFVSSNVNTVGEASFGLPLDTPDVFVGNILADPVIANTYDDARADFAQLLDSGTLVIDYTLGLGIPKGTITSADIGGDLTLIPEPSTVVMLLAGLAGLLLVWRRRRRA